MLYDIGNLLKKKRKEKGLTLEQAGKLIGVSKVTYRDYELNNIKSARMDKLKAIANFLEVPPEDLFNDKKLKNTEQITPRQLHFEAKELIDKTIDITDQEKTLLLQTLEFVCSEKE